LVDKKYEAIWIQRNSGKVDGLATLFNLDKFKLESAKKIDLDEAFEALGITHEMYPDEARKKHKLGLITHLSLVQSPKDHILVVNSHNHHNPHGDVIKYAEIGHLLNETNKELERIRSEFSTDRISVIMAGDYNSRPESATYRLLKHQLPLDLPSINYELDIEALSDPQLAAQLLVQRRKNLGLYEHIANKIKVNKTFMKFESAY